MSDRIEEISPRSRVFLVPAMPLRAAIMMAIGLVSAGAASATETRTTDVSPPGYSGYPIAGPSQAVLPFLPDGDAGCPTFIFRNGYEPGHLVQTAPGAPITYTTSGGYTVKIDEFTITLTDPYGFNTVQHWGDPHENLNGKHIKDWAGAAGWDGSRRSILLGDGTKVTMHSAGPHGVVTTTSIYDDNQNLQFDNSTNTVMHHSLDAVKTQALDDAEHDGETSLFDTNTVTMIASYTNIYNENASFQTTSFNVPLGTTGGCANPNQVNDLFDDPRLGHT